MFRKLIIQYSILFVFSLAIVSCNGQSELNKDQLIDDELSNTDYNILFVGNSLTYTNDLPKLVKEQASEKDLVIGVKMIAYGNYAIVDHWEDGDVQKEINSKKYQFVIIQQGPSSQAEGKQMLLEYGPMYKDICEENDAELAFFMVWPSRSYFHTFEDVIKNYTEAAESSEALLCPVGKAWKEYFDTTGTYDYYGLDGFHPSLKGSRKAAEVIVNTLFQ